MKRYYYTEDDFATKKAAQESLLRLLKPLLPFYTEGCARLEIGVTSAHYEDDTVPMEAFARPLWGLAPFWAGGGRSGTVYADDSFESIYPAGLSAGTDPENPEYWHTCRDFDQKFCEMAAIAYAMLLSPEQVWDPLSDKTKNDLTEWLWEINRHECCACNWQWFAIVTNLALKVRGMPYSRERMESGLAMLEDYYDAGGWYCDGNGGEKDYYNPFVMVSYGLLYAMFMEEEEPERCAHFRQRAMDFAQDYQYWFADDGASIAYGRSMTYRFAQGGFWAFALLSGTQVLPMPMVKGILTRHLVWWLNQPIYDNAGILTIGYAYPNLQMSESYNAPGSPYWALLAFAFLALPDDHPYWMCECAPMPELESLHFLEHAGMLLQRNRGNVVALVPGRFHADGHSHTMEKYAKFAYSSRFGFSISRSQLTLHENAADSMLTFEIDGRFYSRDTTGEGYLLSREGIACRWSPMPYIVVETEIQPTSKGHIRTHRISSEVDCMAYDAGFALPSAHAPLLSRAETATAEKNASRQMGKSVPNQARIIAACPVENSVPCDIEKNESCLEEIAPGPVFSEVKQTTARAVSFGDYCTVTSLSGDGQGQILTPDPNTNLIASKTVIPMAVYKIRKGMQTIRTEFCYL
ncbi:MAG: DUF2264 domain-containing protein [Lachnospiraceae bacterium]|nr:DUF2264 domain-containing protein [Lachnospiraceae bacterium]